MDITQRIRQSLSITEILQTTVEEVRQFLQVDRTLILQLDPNLGGTVLVESVGAEWTAILSTHFYDPCVGEPYIELFKQGFFTAKSDIYTADISTSHLECLANFQVRANLVVPILNGEGLWGLLIAHHCAEPREWQPAEIELLLQLANQVGIAIQQVELLDRVQTELAERNLVESALELAEMNDRLLLALRETDKNPRN